MKKDLYARIIAISALGLLFTACGISSKKADGDSAGQETEDGLLRFLYYTFPMMENDHALDLYQSLKRNLIRKSIR